MRVLRGSRVSLLAIAAAGLAISLTTFAQQPATIADQLSTPERVKKNKWWPLKGAAPRDEYVDNATCAQCHASIVAKQSKSAMALTAVRPVDSTLLKEHAPELNFSLGPYSYRITNSKGNVIYSVQDGTNTISVPLSWGFGTGRMGQSYIFDYHGKTLMVPVSYYGDAKLWDFTVDVSHRPAETLEKALGLGLTSEQRRGCFDCHATNATASDRFEPDKATPGVTCEACHGPGANHVAAAKAGWVDQGATSIFNPARLKPVDSVDFCGSCHRTWWDVVLQDQRGPKSLRFPAYRLQNSRCWGTGDSRITCVACHDPHAPLVTDVAYYDQKCLSCHLPQGSKPTEEHPGAACPVATKDCSSCHMPKSDAAFIHSQMTDHWIRVVRPGEKFPE
jgi:hypothetical protein